MAEARRRAPAGRRRENLDENIVVIRDLHYSRGHRKIFDGLDLEVPRGRVTAIMGPSGTGKTTLLRLITGQILLLPLIGLIFVLETGSVILQVASVRLRGKRLFHYAGDPRMSAEAKAKELGIEFPEIKPFPGEPERPDVLRYDSRGRK